MKYLRTDSIHYRVTGIRSCHLRRTPSFADARQQIVKLLTGKIVVGHDIKNDLKAMEYQHPDRDIRDIAYYMPLRRGSDLRKRDDQAVSLKDLARCVLRKEIQSGNHTSEEDASTTMELYRTVKEEWEVMFGKGGTFLNRNQKGRPIMNLLHILYIREDGGGTCLDDIAGTLS